MEAKINVQSFYSQLLQSSMDLTSTEVTVDVAPVNSVGYEVLEVGETNQEIIKHEGLSGLILQDLLRGLSVSALTDTEVAGNKKTHLINTTIEQTNVHYYLNDKVSNLATETIAGLKTFTLSPKSSLSAGSTTPGAIVADSPSSGGSVDDGTHSYKVTFYNSSTGEETVGSVSSNVVTCTTGNNTVVLTVPVSSDSLDFDQRKIYRTEVGDAGDYKLLATISDNTTTEYTDIIIDSSLGAVISDNATSYELMRFNETVRLSGDQTIGGVKTFNNPPLCSTVPTEGSQFVNKDYVDSKPATRLSFTTYYLGEDIDDRDALSRETLDNTNGGSNANVGRLTVNEGVFQAESFIAGSAASSFNMTVSLQTVGSPTDNLYIEIQGDNAGEPDGTPVTNGTSNNVASGDITSSYTDIAFTWASDPVLVPGTRYWFVIKRDGTQHDTNYYQAEYANNNAFRGGVNKKYTSAWVYNTDASDDLVFAISGADGSAVKSINNSYNSNRGRLAFLGFANSAGSEGDLQEIQNGGRMTGFTGLTPSSPYSIHTSVGEISTVITNPIVAVSENETTLIVGRGYIQMTDAQVTALIGGGEIALHTHPGESPQYISSATVATGGMTVPTGTNVILISAICTPGTRYQKGDLILTKTGKITATLQAGETNSALNTPTFTVTWSTSTSNLIIGGDNPAGTVYYYKNL